MKPKFYLSLIFILCRLLPEAVAQTPVLFRLSKQKNFVVHLQPGSDLAHLSITLYANWLVSKINELTAPGIPLLSMCRCS